MGGRIAQARSYARLSQTALTRLVKVDRKTLSSWENDRTSPTVTQLIRVATVTGFPAAWFVDGVNDPDGGEWAPWDSNPQPADWGTETVIYLPERERQAA